MVKQKKILLRCSDDSVIVMSFITDDEHGLRRDGTPREIEAEIEKASSAWSKERLPILGWEEITDDSIPTDRSFRDAWATDGKKIHHDMPKSRSIHLDRIRSKRNALLDATDGDWMKATGQGKKSDAAKIEAKRQTLRDIPSTWGAAIDGSESVEELAAMWPEELED